MRKRLGLKDGREIHDGFLYSFISTLFYYTLQEIREIVGYGGEGVEGTEE